MSVRGIPPGTRVLVGKSKRVHIIRPGTVYTRSGYGTTYCGYYGAFENGWMTRAYSDATCKTCVKGHQASEDGAA